MKIAILDTLYPDFIRTLPPVTDYASGLDFALSRMFGTFDAYSRYLKLCGWETVDIIANYGELQAAWLGGHGAALATMTSLLQVNEFKPDVVFLQDLSLYPTSMLQVLKQDYTLAGQCSCRFDDDEKLKQFDVLFTSFPFYVERFKNLGIDGRFLPLAFDPLVLERARIPEYRTYPVSFVGGYGRHWGMDRLFVKLAEETPIQFWGYGFENAPEPVRKKWRGEVWGLDMYEVYLNSRIVVNRHGGIAGGYSNNLRMFEATGCCALLLTEHSKNIGDYFAGGECAVYDSPEDAVAKINYFLSRPDELLRVASNGQECTLTRHTYAQRMPIVSQVLKEKMAVHARTKH